jgi:hypothetical protein
MSMGTDQIGPTISSTKKNADARQIATVGDGEDWNQKGETPQHADDDDVAARSTDIAGSSIDPVAGKPTERITNDPGQHDAGGEPGGMLEVEVKILSEEARDPGEKYPQRPAIAEIDGGHRQHAPEEGEPGHLRRFARGWAQPGQGVGCHFGMRTRIVAKAPKPQRHPEKAAGSEHDEGTAPRDT